MVIKIPGFRKLFDPDIYSQRLQLPSALTSKMKGQFPNGIAYLRNSFDNLWNVEVVSQSENLYFGKGWEKFVEDNGVVQGDDLVFEFKGDSCYHVQLYGQDGCEKLEYFGSFQVSILSSDEQEEMEKEEEDGDDDDDEEEYEVEEEEEEEDDDDDDDYDYDDEEYEKPARKSNDSRKRSKEKVGSEEFGNKPEGKYVDVFESGLIAYPRNAYFIAHLKKNKRNGLFIPVEVIKDHSLKFQSEIIIVGEDGKEFHSPIKTWADGRKVITRGWRSFRRWNYVKDDDTCLVEVLSTQTVFVQVLKFQEGKWMPRPRTRGLDTNVQMLSPCSNESI